MDGGPVLCIREAKLGNSFQLIFCLTHEFERALKLAEQREGMFPISHVGMEWLQIFFLWQMKRWWQRLSFCLEDIKISVILAHLIFRYLKVTLCPQFHQALSLQHLPLLYCASNLGHNFQQGNWSLRGALVTSHLQTLCPTGSVFLPFLLPHFELGYHRKLCLPFQNTYLLPATSFLKRGKGKKGNSYTKVIAKCSKRSESAALPGVSNSMTVLRQWLKPSHYLHTDTAEGSLIQHVEKCTKYTTQSQPGRADLEWELLGDLRDVGSPSLLLVQRHHDEILEELPLLVLDQVPLQALVPRRLLQPRLHVHQALAVSYGNKGKSWLWLSA